MSRPILGQCNCIPSMKDIEDKDIEDDLIIRCLSGNADNRDMDELREAIAASPGTAERFFELKNVWDATPSPDDVNSIDTLESLSRTLDRIYASSLSGDGFRRKAMNIIMKTAAILALPLLVLSIFLYYTGGNAGMNAGPALCQEIKAMPGSMVHTFLPDSTEIWLNGGSRLTYRQEHDSPRLVDISGEAFFSVAKDSEHPFRVHTPSGLDVEALGTEFNVCSYSTDTITTVTLTEGSVRVNDSSAESSLSPGQSIVYNANKKKMSLYLGNTDKMISWRDGDLVFSNEMLKNVYKRLGQIFNVSFEVDSRLDNAILYATFEDASLDQILSLIKRSTPLDYEVVDGYEENGRITGTKRIKVISR